MRAIGLMSGTSLDGMDVALLETDGTRILSHGPEISLPFSMPTKTLLKAAVDAALLWRFEGAPPASFAPAAKALAKSAQAAVMAVLDAADLDVSAIDIVGFHGQTVLHAPPVGGAQGKTCQLGDAQALANTLGISVVHDFRSKDMLNGGHGAPLAPAYHQALASDLPKPLMVLNIGGVGNLTWLGEGGQMLAFDTGPGNGPIDALIQAAGRGDMDAGGKIAALGQVNDSCLQTMLSADYFSAKPPKSADRWDFDWSGVQALSLEDAAATLTAFCAASVAKALHWLPQRPCSILVCGGGRKNPVLMEMLGDMTGINCKPVEDVGWHGDALEAEAFAFLAVRYEQGLPTSWPQTTGVMAPVCGGALVRP